MPDEYGKPTPEPSFFEKLIIAMMMIFSTIFFRPKHRG